MNLLLRPASAADAAALAHIYSAAVHHISPALFSAAQKAAWLQGGADTAAFWAQRIPRTRPMVAERHGGSADFVLKPGGYFIYCGFGYAGTTEHVVVGTGLKAESIILNAGGVRLAAVTGKDRPPLDSSDLSFDIFAQELDSHGEPKAVALDVAPGQIVRLPAQVYNVIANYGDANARTTADIDVKAGKLSDVTLTEKAAKITLKLVSSEGGEAIADTRWSILTLAGDLVTSGVGAFPSFVLA